MKWNELLKRINHTKLMKNNAPQTVMGIFFLTFSLFSNAIGYTESVQMEKDKSIVQGNVLEWSDSAFYFHEDYRFENFRAHYTDDFYIIMLRSDKYKTKIENLKKAKKNQTYVGSDKEYEIELNDLKRKYKKFQIMVDSYSNRVKYFEVLFWSNIKTRHGYPVYYAHRFKLSNDYFIMAALVKSSIGNKNPDNKIIYN